MKLTTSILIIMLFAVISFGQTISFKVSVDKDQINQGDYIELRYETNQTQGQFTAPNFEGFQILSGPNVSKSTSIFNGEMHQEASYSFRLLAIESGTQNIFPATLIFNGEEYTSGKVEIKVKENLDFDYNEAVRKSQNLFFPEIQGKRHFEKEPLKKLPKVTKI